MAHPTNASKLAAAFITGASVLGIAYISNPWDGDSPTVPQAQEPAQSATQPLVPQTPPEPEPAVEQAETPAVDVPEVAPEQPEQPEEVAVVIPQAPVLSGPPAVQFEQPAAAAVPAVIVPAFDLLRVEPDGSVVIAGTASPSAKIEAITGNRLLGSSTAATNGDFVVVLDQQLEPGDYEIVLRADTDEGVAATSVQTAIVSIPKDGSSGVLALVEEPGAPSRLISVGDGTVPPMAPVEPEVLAEAEETTPLADPVDETAQAQEQPPEQPSAVNTANVRIEAVEIDGSTIFVAGQSKPGSLMRVYANEILLGETATNPDGSFLVQVNRSLPVGDYLIRADLLSDNGSDVVMRAAVPFVREPGEKLAAIAVPPSVSLPQTAPDIQADSTQTDAALVVPESLSVPATPPAIDDQANDDSAVQTQVQQPLKAADDSVIIRRGDTLWHISRRVYGQGIKYTTIYKANTDQIRDPDRIWPGQIFTVPEVAEPNESDG